MNFIERKMQIIDLLNGNGGILNINSLAKKLYVSQSTLRRDLIQLEKEGVIIRYHGGISLVPNSALENSIELRRMESPDKKSTIARLAFEFIHDSMVLFLDSSSTVSYLIPLLKGMNNITIITNGINIAAPLNTADNLKCYLCPGVLKNRSLSVVGEYAADFLNNFRAEAVFFSCKAINSNGVFEGDDSQALNKRNMIKNADKKILLCDTGKELTTGYFKLANFTDIDYLISDGCFSDGLNSIIEQNGCEFIHP